jgi:glycosyltransferase involved in cell wall biosynthesis
VEACRSTVQELGLKNITLTGFVENRRLALYQAAGDILLMPYGQMIAGSGGGNSADICSPMKMFEYIAAGRAILASDLPVLREVLNESNAVFCTADDLKSWEAGLKFLLDDPQFMHRISGQARADASGYSWVSRAEKIIEGLV